MNQINNLMWVFNLLIFNSCHIIYIKIIAEEAILENITISDTDLSNSNLSGALLEDTCLVKANLQGANLTSAKLRYADLRFANLKDADLKDINIDDTTCLIGVNLERAKNAEHFLELKNKQEFALGRSVKDYTSEELDIFYKNSKFNIKKCDIEQNLWQQFQSTKYQGIVKSTQSNQGPNIAP